MWCVSHLVDRWIPSTEYVLFCQTPALCFIGICQSIVYGLVFNSILLTSFCFSLRVNITQAEKPHSCWLMKNCISSFNLKNSLPFSEGGLKNKWNNTWENILLWHVIEIEVAPGLILSLLFICDGFQCCVSRRGWRVVHEVISSGLCITQVVWLAWCKLMSGFLHSDGCSFRALSLVLLQG